MLYGMSGASGTGKTTLAKRVAEDLGITFMPTSVTESAKRHGFNPVAPLTLTERIQLQHCLLSDHIELIAKAGRPLIVDRTPIDMIAYMMAEFHMHSHLVVSPDDLRAADEFVKLCLDFTVKLYDHVFLLGPLDSYEPDPKRPAPNRAYQTHTQLIMQGALGMLQDEINYSLIPITDPHERFEHVHDTIVERMDEICKARASSPHIH